MRKAWDMDNKEYMWKSTIDELVNGYREEEDRYVCVFCGKSYVKGSIYTIQDSLFDAYGAIRRHKEIEHGDTVDYLLDHNTSLTGISDVQQQILKLMSLGKDDKEISKEVGIAQSTVRNHRFKLREKEKQAKLYLAMMQSLEDKTKRSINQTDAGIIEEIHATARMVDDRYSITDQEHEKTVQTYMDENGAIKQFPAKEKKKIIILNEVMKNFVKDREYKEVEVNRILKRLYEDYPTIRRALIEYGFLDRTEDCSIYRVKER